MKNKLRNLVTSLLLGFLLLSSCSSISKIKINGPVHFVLEVGEKFVDQGVTYPEKYTMIKTGEVNEFKLGTYELKYAIFTGEGELVKELFRFVNVVDTQKPTYTEADLLTFYAGIKYTVDDFLEDYSDNYDAKHRLIIEPSDVFYFKDAGREDFEITISDLSGNQTTFKTTINVVLDFEVLIDNIYANQFFVVSKGTTGIGSKYVRVDIDSTTSFSYYDSGSVHFLKNFSSNLGSRASIQISGTYGELNKARLNYHVSGTGNTYSAGFITFNALLDYDDLNFNYFDNAINDLNLREQDMLDEMNPRVLGVLTEFKEYFDETLHLTFK